MFLRHWSGLPEDPKFPCDLEKLGYFVNDIDEIRSIENPDHYFKYHLDQNERVNDCQSFAFNTAVEDIVHARLEKEGLDKILLPLGVTPTTAHVPIFASTNVKVASRVVLILGDTSQMLGVLAMRVANGHGGVDKGSMVSIVREIRKQRCSPDDGGPPGIVIANPSELWWWPEGGRALDTPRRNRVPMASAVHLQRLHDDRLNTISQNEDYVRHTEYVFKHVIPHLTRPDVKVDVVAIGDGCQALESLFSKEENWAKYAAGRLNAMVLLGGHWNYGELRGEGFKKFLQARARVYIPDASQTNTPIANYQGNPRYPAFTSFGCPVYSACCLYTEMILVEAHAAILDWLQEVSDTPGYRNDQDMAVVNPVVAGDGEEDDEAMDQAWVGVSEEEKPYVEFWDDKNGLDRKLARAWIRREKTGVFCISEDEDGDEDVK